MGDRPESAVGGRHGFPDAAAVFQWRPRSVAEIKDTCIVALDTNVLAVPYTVSSRSLDEIAAVYRRLRDQDRLRLPGQVAREFVGVRNKKLGELLQQLNNRSSEAKAFGPERYPLLVGLPEYERMLDLEQAMNTTVKEYRKAAKAVTGAVRQWTWNDPVSLVYAGIFDNNVVVDAGVPDEEISADAEGRKRHGIPPGHKDAGKEQNAYGDLVIWRTLLRLGAEATRDVLFVTEETKADWWHRSMDVTLYPRHELIEEFRRETGGCTFQLASFGTFLDLFGADQDVVTEVEQVEATRIVTEDRRNAVRARDGRILVVRRAGRYGAVKPLRQTSTDEDAAITYQWWYQPDGTAILSGPDVLEGSGRASEKDSRLPVVEVGPLRIEWSVAGRGSGWFYFHSRDGSAERYEFSATNATRIEDIDDASLLTFVRKA